MGLKMSAPWTDGPAFGQTHIIQDGQLHILSAKLRNQQTGAPFHVLMLEMIEMIELDDIRWY